MTLPCAASLSRVAASPSASASAAGGPPKPRGAASALGGMRARMFGLFFLIVFCCALGLISVASLIQQRDQRGPPAAGPRAAAAADTALVQARAPDADQHQTDQHQADQADQHGAAEMVIAQVAGVAEGDTALNARIPLDELSDYECVGWRAQRDCRPDGGDDHGNDRACNATVSFGESGFCSVRHRRTGEQRRVLRMHCDSLRYDVRFTCADFAEMLAFGPRASLYEHDATFSVDKCRSALAEDQASALAATDTRQKQLRTYRHPLPNFRRGVLLVVYEKLLESVFASVRALRALGCDLPVEIWYKASETNVAHPLLRALVEDYGCFLREIKDARADRFYTKIYAVFYSAFDQVLLLDSDNFAVRDPTYLFDSDEFVKDGAMFWPDFWQPKKTIFNIQPTSFVWEALELEYVDMFEQESGQVLIDRTRHLKALNALMYYAFHPTLLEDMRLVWGDKDLFRFAWMKTSSSFHMIAMPPGAAGLKLPDQNIFCGVTMVQHDPQHRIVFLHRNQEKLSSENKQLVWRHVQDFRVDEVPLDQYDVRGANGGRYYPQFKRCYGKDIYYEKAFTVTPVDELPFADLEPMLLEFVQQAADIVAAWRVSRGEGEGDAAAEEEVERALAGPAV